MKYQYGEFSAQGDQFFVQRVDTPQPWHNQLSSNDVYSRISQVGQGELRFLNQHATPITRRLIFVRDNDSSESWNATGNDQTAFDHFQAVHAQWHTRIETVHQAISSSTTFFLPEDEPLEVWRVKVSNQSRTKRRLTLFAGVLWGNKASETFETRHSHGILFGDDRSIEDGATLFVTATRTIDSFETQASAFIGRRGTLEAPEAVAEGKLSRSAGAGDQALGVTQINLTLGAGDETEIILLVGAVTGKGSTAAKRRADADRRIKAIRQRYQEAGRVGEAMIRCEQSYSTLTQRILVKSSDSVFDAFFNYWKKHQAIAALRASQSELEKLTIAASLTALDPEQTRRTLVDALQRQHRDGSVVFDDNPDGHLSLLTTAVAYLTETANLAFLGEKRGYADASEASVLHHLTRAVDRSLKSLSSRGLPAQQTIAVISNPVVRERFETACLLYSALRGLLPILDAVGEHELVHRYDRAAEKLRTSINAHFWQNSWYASELENGRATLGRRGAEAYRIGLREQAIAVLSGVSTRDHGHKALSEAERSLATKVGALNFAPAFATPTSTPASMAAPGCGTNSTVVNRDVALAVAALAKLGEGDEAFRVWQRSCPASLGAHPDQYRAEPFAFSAGLAGPSQSAFGWGSGASTDPAPALFWQAMLENVIGLQPTLGGLKIDPCLPRDWRKVEVTRTFRGAEYHIRIVNSLRSNRGVDRILVDGVRITGSVVPPQGTGVHFVEAVLG